MATAMYRAPASPIVRPALGLTLRTAQVGRTDGDVAAGLQRAVQRIEADYEVPFLAHATMEPQTCTAHVKDGKVEVWAPTQDAPTALATAAAAAGVPNENVVVHGTMLGGGFGRRGAIQEFVAPGRAYRQGSRRAGQARVVARGGYPARLLSAFGMARLVAGLDADGMPVAWKIRLTGPSFVPGSCRALA